MDQKRNLKNQIDEWIEQGVIEPANSPWASPLVPVKKKDGRMRWVTDLRLLNSATVKDAYPLTNIQENLQKLQGATIFTEHVAPVTAYKSRKKVIETVQHSLARLGPSIIYECHSACL